MENEISRLTGEVNRLKRRLEEESRARKRLEKILALNEEEFFSIFDAIQVGFYRTDSRGRLTMANRAVREMLGFESRGLIPDIDMVDLYRDPGDRDVLLSTISSQGRISAYELDLKRRDGGIITVLVNAHVRHTDQGEFAGVQGTVVDISHRKEDEAEKVHAQKLAAIGSLAAGIAHEINTPVQYITDNTAFLKDAFGEIQAVFQACQELADAGAGKQAAAVDALRNVLADADLAYLNQEIPQALTQSLDGLSRVTGIIRSMKEFSHSNPDTWESADINRILENTLTVSRNAWKYLARIRREFQEDLPMILCNPGELSQVFLNMVINACHAIEEGMTAQAGERGTITLSTRQREGGVEIRISDTGTGIPESVQDQVFNPFFTTKTVGRGTGQGLAIAHRVVDRHRGRISFESLPGKGTTFTVALPFPAEDNG